MTIGVTNKSQIKFKSGLAANINSTATQNLAVEGEPHWTTDTKQLFVYDGSTNLRVSGRTDGIADYNDTATATTPITLVANTWTTITNDGLGAYTNTSYLPENVTSLMDTSTGQFDFTELSLGDYVIIRNDYTVTPSTNNTLLELRYQLGTGGSAYTLQKIVGRLDSGSGIGYRFSLTPDFIYMGDTNTRDNLVTLQLKLSGGGSVVNAGSAIGVNKR